MNKKLDLSKDQYLFTIRKDGKEIGDVAIENSKLVTHGYIGEGNTYDNFIELLKGLQGFDICIDNLYW